MIKIPQTGRGAALLAAALAAGTLLAGCGAAASTPGRPATSSSTPDDVTAAIVACYRAHGDPSFPDPVYDPADGRWHFAVSPGTAPESTRQACQHLFPTNNVSPPVPQPRVQALVKLAECLRKNGVPNWPDPDPDGSYPLPPALQTKTPAYVRAAQDCQRLWPSGGIDAHAAG